MVTGASRRARTWGFDFEVAEQDGFRFRAVRVFLGSRSGAEGTPVRADTDAYGSVLRFEK